MVETKPYTVPDVWTWDQENGGTFSSINRPFAGSTYESSLPVGDHPFQLYSQGTPNGVKVTILLEELLNAGYKEAEYDAWLVRIGKGEQFSSGFVEINPIGFISTKPLENCSPFPIRTNHASYSASL